jgi:SRSO17 transposase
VHHPYCGQLGKQANCQVAVTLSIANHHASLAIAYRLYLPRDKTQIALEQIRPALLAGVLAGGC